MKKSVLFMDLGGLSSFAGSLMAAELFAKKTNIKSYFVLRDEVACGDYTMEHLEMLSFSQIEENVDIYQDITVIDFTQPGQGVAKTCLLFQETYNFYLQQDISYSQNSFFEKIEYIETILKVSGLLKVLQAATATPILTYSSELAAQLNLRGVKTIELCYRFRKPGSFLPGSVVIFGDTFSLLKKDDIKLIFEFYQTGKMDDLFLNKNVLEVDWDILYYKMDRTQQSIITQKYPISLTESFLDSFLKAFLSQQVGRTYSIEQLMNLSQQMDAVDLEMTLEFLRKTLSRCVQDVDKRSYPFTQSHWNWVRPYVDCYSKDRFPELKQTLQYALQGLDMYLRIHDRQRKVVGMH